jgi:hypothetical protein
MKIPMISQFLNKKLRSQFLAVDGAEPKLYENRS